MSFRTVYKVAYRAVVARLIRWPRAHFRHSQSDQQSPLRAELFSAAQMEQHGKALAESHALSRLREPDRLLQRLDENRKILGTTCNLLTVAARSRQRIAPAGEWLLDNFYLIEEQIRTARKHLPKGYSRELPRLARGHSRGLPRIYDLALEAISHGDGRVDSETLVGFVVAYQTVTALTLGELWAIPIMLQLALIENLRRISARITTARIQLNQAQVWADRMMQVAESDPKSLILVIADMARSDPPMVSPFIAELARRLQGHGPELALPLTWIEQRLAESSQTIEQMVQAENQTQAADQVSISNTIGSLRFLDAMDWREFVESMSKVEEILHEDVGATYREMDFATRDRYRHVIERTAKRCNQSESEVARAAIGLAGQYVGIDGEHDRTAHVGYYLIDRGLPELEAMMGARLPLTAKLRRLFVRAPLTLHLGAILLMTGIFTEALLERAQLVATLDWRLPLLCVLALLGASQMASALTNWLTTQLMSPQRLPRMDYALGLPPEQRTLVVIPTLLDSAHGVEALLEALEVRFLGNQDASLHFGLLTDFRDAAEESCAEDAPLLLLARRGIEKLNEKYQDIGNDRFFLIHRQRRWNPAERVWMGHERKRGKLGELNALLRGAAGGRFSLIVGKTAALSTVKYVITLDTDTQLPRDSARQLVATMAHPLNRPLYDEARQRVVGGYGILQPRLASSVSDVARSRYKQLCGSEPGIDPYTGSVSNVYQDLFGEGSYIGKGIYEVDAFERALKDRLPENRILSHDLLEGCYARSGLLSDVDLFEEYPTSYLTDMARHRRWIRGDWQIARWLFPRVPGPDGRRQSNPLSAVSRWKIFDNLRRSLVPAALTALLAMGWTVLPHPGFWTLAVVAIVAIPALLGALVDTLRKPSEMMLRQHLSAVLGSAAKSLSVAAFKMACLPYEALLSLDAIVRTTWRMLISHRGLLEWNVASDNALPPGPESRSGKWLAGAGSGVMAFHRSMAIAPLSAAVATIALVALRPDALVAAAPILALWFAAPSIAWWLSRPLIAHEVTLAPEQTVFLRKIARKTWTFFERFVGPEDHWLPPDNFQEVPVEVIAHRTSPTNMGLALLSNLAAYDFGYILAGALLARTQNTLCSMAALERHRGHFYNWYDTQTLAPLPPHYISSVDSGNLAGHLLTLRAGLLALPDQALLGPRLYDGITDTLEAMTDAVPDNLGAPIARLRTLLAEARAQIPAKLPALLQSLKSIENGAAAITAALTAGPAEDSPSDVSDGVAVLHRQCRAAVEELTWLAPWLVLPKAPQELADGLTAVAEPRSLRDLPAYARRMQLAIDARLAAELDIVTREWLIALNTSVTEGSTRAQQRITSCEHLAQQAGDFSAMEYAFLYDKRRRLLAIGYNVDEFRLDNSYYDLLASEARLSSFVAIAQGELPQESWFALGRLRTTTGGKPILLSWSGSMFEYLMPLLVMPSYSGTLLDQTCRAAVARQIAYGKQLGLPWGISESGFNTFDASFNYQYHAFGVPGLGLKRGLSDDAVVAPYASALALMVAPDAACTNLQRLQADGLEGRYGFYEAVDYTASRLPSAPTALGAIVDAATKPAGVVVRSFMAHHQGMSLLSLASLLLDQPMQRRFESDPQVKSTLLLLEERIPKRSALRPRAIESGDTDTYFHETTVELNLPIGSNTPTPEVQLLSNGRYHVMVSNAGGGYSQWNDLAVTRWREDISCDSWGTFTYLRDVANGEYWSATHQPTRRRAEIYEAMFSEGRAEFRRRDQDIETHSEIVVSPEDDIELRRLCIINRSHRTRTIEVTSYAEPVLTTAAADAMHPSFGKLFVQTEILREHRAILCTRRPRSISERAPWMFHLMATNGSEVSDASFETDRMRFIGRDHTLASPQAMTNPAPLSNTDGSVLDPIVSIRCHFVLHAGQSAVIDLITGAAADREACMTLIGKYQDRHRADRVVDLARTHDAVTLRQLNVSESEARLYRRLASPVVYANAALRAQSEVLMQNRRGQSGLWAYAISGDLPIVLLKVSDSTHLDLARQMIQCHAYWRLKGLKVDLVIWNEDHLGYRKVLQDQIVALIATGTDANAIDRPGGIFVRSAELISSEDRTLLRSVARVIVAGDRGTLADQVKRRVVIHKGVARLAHTREPFPEHATPAATPHASLILDNGFGGFTEDGREYITTTTQARTTPLPWVNVLANPNFGTVVSENGLAYTWSENAHEFRLTPWSDDAVGASGGEALYLRDEDSGQFWSPAPLPVRDSSPYVTRHGFGYSVFEHSANGIRSELWIYVDRIDAVKFSVLKVRNISGRSRRLSATGYVEWVLGDLRPKSAMHVVTEIDPTSGALFARNDYNTEFAGRIAFFDVDDGTRTLTGDRTEFLGRNGTLDDPDAMTRAHLSGRLGAALDPCGAIQVPFELANGQEREIIFRLGAGNDRVQACALARRLRTPGAARAALQRVHEYWNRTLGTVQIETPDPALNVLANGWLVYQVLACRLWARSGFYQSGGAYGFRDQLQDVMALVHSEPRLVREHLLRCAQRQFPEGDVQHWWHPPTGRGVRTRCSDDYLWLPLAVCRYVQCTGDIGVLEENLPFLSGRPLAADEESYYDEPGRASEVADLYQHCLRAIVHGLRFGERGLPLMGSGDWNDGMNLVGIEGKGESVWLGFFLYEVLTSFSGLARAHGDTAFAERCVTEAEQLRANLDQHGWDGAWYRRAWFDDGTPLGSSVNTECAIDSIAQSGSVLSGAGDAARSRQAMDALDQHLVDREHGVIRLLEPPFDQSAMNPGYIRGYVPGVRENGGQYTHAAVWAAMAFAKLGDHKRAWELMDILNPVKRARTAADVAICKTEPYAVAADVYAVAPHAGRGGWTWYTGSAGWMYRLMLESLLGLTREGDRLRIAPCIPEDWRSFKLSYRFGETIYDIVVRQIHDADGATALSLDDIEQNDSSIPLVDDGQRHRVELKYRQVGSQQSPVTPTLRAANQLQRTVPGGVTDIAGLAKRPAM
ncbi:cyclic beta 1-2 glucan synthetase [Sinimarinibacterium sp. CAU 1509]|uniref:glycoside hydrolase family 94 protein n=1 Tax=Sinimarinibacterium sp. CAU 1509 TaxID=2562283 RepID=UPI0010AC1145|nr:glycoside hydrolase family 94 protein [Sinimarinibacterium sp. CAU 1509]TJY63223.1 cyclic beta 1-2 glucan synthetase [Sinimarinibacterium sp. CAU 1509]